MLKFILNGQIVFQKEINNREYLEYSKKQPGDIINGRTKIFMIKDVFIDYEEIRLEIVEYGI